MLRRFQFMEGIELPVVRRVWLECSDNTQYFGFPVTGDPFRDMELKPGMNLR